MNDTHKIGSLELDNPFMLAPMEAVNCTSFRVLCRRRGAGLVFTDMIDADVFMETVNEHDAETAIKKYLNPNDEEKPLGIQLGGANKENLVATMKILEPYADLFDFNAGCPLPYMLGKKGGAYFSKHTDQLIKVMTELRANTTKPLTVKIRAGWDEDSINAVEAAIELEKTGIDAIIIHPRTRMQKYERKSDWLLARKVKEAVSIPVCLSGDVNTPYFAYMAFMHSKCDLIMIGRGAKNNPSVFTEMNEYYKNKLVVPDKPLTRYEKKTDQVKQDFFDFIELYETIENRDIFSEIQDHALWFARECKRNRYVTKDILRAEYTEDLEEIFEDIRFEDNIKFRR